MPHKKRDVLGQRFGRLVVLGDTERRDRTKHRWVLCRCDCGNEYATRMGALVSGRTRSCGCLQHENLAAVHQARRSDLSGRKFGRLTAIERGTSRKLGKTWHAYWICRCDCGQTVDVQRSALTSHSTRSCGCLAEERHSVRARTHGGSGWPEYRIWGSIVQRCTNKNNPAWKDYGGRGIFVCEEWRTSFQAFIDDVGRRPEPGMQLDRIENNDGYHPGNVRWISRDKNMRNRSFISRREAEALKSAARDQLVALVGRLRAIRRWTEPGVSRLDAILLASDVDRVCDEALAAAGLEAVP